MWKSIKKFVSLKIKIMDLNRQDELHVMSCIKIIFNNQTLPQQQIFLNKKAFKSERVYC